MRRHWCTYADDPEPPPPLVCHYFTCCPGVCYPDALAVTLFNTTPDICDCVVINFLEVTWDATVGSMGGWKGTDPSCGGGGILVEIFPESCVTGGMIWTCRITTGVVVAVKSDVVDCGHGHLFEGLKIRPNGCPFAIVNVSMSWPGSLPP